MTNELVCESQPFVRSWDECVMCARDWSGGALHWGLTGPLVIPALVVGVSWVRFPGRELVAKVAAY